MNPIWKFEKTERRFFGDWVKANILPCRKLSWKWDGNRFSSKIVIIIFFTKLYPVRKLPEVNDKTTRDFKKIDGKNGFFSIFFKLSQAVSSDVKMVPKCFATLKATPKASGHILRSFEKKFFRSNSRPSEANFSSRGYSTSWKWHFMGLFKT